MKPWGWRQKKCSTNAGPVTVISITPYIGDPPRVDLNNEFAYDVGAGYHFSKETEATLFYRESTALVDNNDNPRDIILGVNHDLGEDIAIHGNLGFGLSDGSPDTSVLLGMSYWFN